jgi:NTE family protein
MKVREILDQNHRDPVERRVFVFSGGGLNGATQAGMVRELLGAGVYPDAVVGVSAGAMNAVYVASTDLDLAGEGLVSVWNDVALRGIYDNGSTRRMWALARSLPSIDNGSKLAGIINRHCSVNDLSECKLPIRVGTLRLPDGETIWWDRGPAFPILCASAAIPGVYPPVRIGSGLFVDGSVSSPIPLSAAYTLAPTQIIVLDSSLLDDHNRPMPTSALGVLLSSFDAVRKVAADAERARCPVNVEILTITAGQRGIMKHTDTSCIAALIDAGAAAAQGLLSAHPHLTRTLSTVA